MKPLKIALNECQCPVCEKLSFHLRRTKYLDASSPIEPLAIMLLGMNFACNRLSPFAEEVVRVILSGNKLEYSEDHSERLTQELMRLIKDAEYVIG